MTGELRRIALRPEAAIERFDEWARARGWALFDELPRGHAAAYERVYKPAGEASDVAAGWCEEHTVGVRLVWVLGAPGLVAELEAALPHHPRAELLERAASDDLGAAVDALRALVMLEANLPPSAELLSLYERFAVHESPVVRRIAIHLGWAGNWRELLPLVERRREADTTLAEGWGRLAMWLQGADRRA
ncbi:MAG TPA: hypothetical protein VFS43_11960 [Polyangiaceae bacterium]|nr:hypothetical protein [Polyangiaceae bacterium]